MSLVLEVRVGDLVVPRDMLVRHGTKGRRVGCRRADELLVLRHGLFYSGYCRASAQVRLLCGLTALLDGPCSQSLVLVPIPVIGEAVRIHAKPRSHQLGEAFVAIQLPAIFVSRHVDVLDASIGGIQLQL